MDRVPPEAEAELRASLSAEKLSALKKRAKEAGVGEGEIEAADDADDIKAAVIDLIAERERQERGGAMRAELSDVTVDVSAQPSWLPQQPNRTVAQIDGKTVEMVTFDEDQFEIDNGVEVSKFDYLSAEVEELVEVAAKLDGALPPAAGCAHSRLFTSFAVRCSAVRVRADGLDGERRSEVQNRACI